MRYGQVRPYNDVAKAAKWNVVLASHHHNYRPIVQLQHFSSARQHFITIKNRIYKHLGLYKSSRAIS